MKTYDITISRCHSLGLNKARAVLADVEKQLAAKYANHFDTIQWNGDKTACEIRGSRFYAEIYITEDNCSVKIQLIGFLAKLAKSKIEQVIMKQIDEFLLKHSRNNIN